MDKEYIINIVPVKNGNGSDTIGNIWYIKPGPVQAYILYFKLY